MNESSCERKISSLNNTSSNADAFRKCKQSYFEKSIEAPAKSLKKPKSITKSQSKSVKRLSKPRQSFVKVLADKSTSAVQPEDKKCTVSFDKSRFLSPQEKTKNVNRAPNAPTAQNRFEPRKLSLPKTSLNPKPVLRENFMKTQNMSKFLRLISPEAKKPEKPQIISPD
jgi:hypothetical protein